MLKLFGLALCVSVALAILICGAHLTGRLRSVPASIAKLHLTDCAPPCWIGITPGLTTVEAAKDRMIAVYGGQIGVQIRDSGFADRDVSPTTVENAIEGDDFYLVVRLNISALVDGKNEVVQSIDLFELPNVSSGYTLTVADILGAFGAPQGAMIEDMMSMGSEISLKYPGWDVVFYAHARRVELTENPHFYFGSRDTQTPSTNYRRWKGFVTLALAK